jgi:hypothetical protein
MPNHPSGQAFGVEFEIGESILPSGEAYVQVCSLFTTSRGERRIRFITLFNFIYFSNEFVLN